MSKTEITIADGKYTVIFDQGNLSALRYGEPWRDLTGDNLIYWMMVEIERLREAHQQAYAQLRHAYQMSLQGLDKDQKAYATGLIGPVIQKLEESLT